MGIIPDDDLHGYDIQLVWDLLPRRTVMLSDYCIQKTEVTVTAYRDCVARGRCTEEIEDQTDSSYCNYSQDPLDELENHPMNCVSWKAGRQFCQ